MPHAGPIVHEALSTLATVFAGPVAHGQMETTPTEFAGPVVHAPLATLATEFAGPSVHGELLAAPGSSSGGGSDTFVKALAAGHGSVFDHTAVTVPLTSSGANKDSFPAPILSETQGPIFDHNVEALLVVAQMGPVLDSFPGENSSSASGPAFDHVVETIVVVPTQSPTVTPRKRILETLSPYIYRLEVEPGGARRITGKSNR